VCYAPAADTHLFHRPAAQLFQGAHHLEHLAPVSQVLWHDKLHWDPAWSPSTRGDCRQVLLIRCRHQGPCWSIHIILRVRERRRVFDQHTPNGVLLQISIVALGRCCCSRVVLTSHSLEESRLETVSTPHLSRGTGCWGGVGAALVRPPSPGCWRVSQRAREPVLAGPRSPGHPELGSNACWTGAGTAAKLPAPWTAQGQSLALNRNRLSACDPDLNAGGLNTFTLQSDGGEGVARRQGKRQRQTGCVQCV
jgi:hypothetical protein